MKLALDTTFVLTNEDAGEDVTPAVLEEIALAIDHALQNAIKNTWGGQYRCVAKGTPPPTTNTLVVHLRASSDVKGAAGYHDDTSINVFRDGLPSLTSGAFSLSVVVSHEIFETGGDPGANRWAIADDGTLYALELCDAVEGFAWPSPVNGVSLSDFLFPSFFDPGGAAPYSHMGKPTAPMTAADDDGADYQITMVAGKEAQVTAVRKGAVHSYTRASASVRRAPSLEVHAFRRSAKLHPSSRTSLRLQFGKSGMPKPKAPPPAAAQP